MNEFVNVESYFNNAMVWKFRHEYDAENSVHIFMDENDTKWYLKYKKVKYGPFEYFSHANKYWHDNLKEKNETNLY